MLVEASRSLLLLVDLQTKLAPAVDQAEACISRCHLLLVAARRLSVPVLVTEHCSGQVGPTVPGIRNHLDFKEILQKHHFNGVLEAEISDAVAARHRPTIIVAGMEAHVCVLQTAFGLKDIGYEPVVVADAIASRQQLSRDLAISRMRHHGINITNTEMVIFEWLKAAGTEEFKDLLPMIKKGSVD